jgi:hypothetical protein
VLSEIMKELRLDSALSSAIAADYERFSTGLPDDLEDYVRECYRLDLSSEYGGLPIKNPFGKGSGQLSVNLSQVRKDAQDGLGFVVLKTIIAQDSEGAQSMSEWAVHETRMVVERITGADEREGWTVTWKGRGWYDTFDAYLQFYSESLAAGRDVGMLVIPSCKYHLPRESEGEWKLGEYEYTTRKLLDVWDAHHPGTGVMPIEKDFSPTLAGSDRASQVNTVLRWLTTTARLIHRAASPRPISVGLKIFNAVFEDDFQLEMLRAINERCEGEDAPDFLIYANRLFDPNREFEGVRGVAYGGPDLSARNLAILGHRRMLEYSGEEPICGLPLSATGNIESGRMAVEYLLRGASSFQIHTYFQLPSSEYRMRGGSKTACALHELYFNPERGLLPWLLHLRCSFDWPEDWNIKQMAEFCVDPANHLWASQGEAVPAAR